MVSLLIQLNDHNHIPKRHHPSHQLFLQQFMTYHPHKKENICFLHGMAAPFSSDAIQWVPILDDAPLVDLVKEYSVGSYGRIFALCDPIFAPQWFPLTDFLYITQVPFDGDIEAPVIQDQFSLVGKYPWERTMRSVWLRSAP